MSGAILPNNLECVVKVKMDYFCYTLMYSKDGMSVTYVEGPVSFEACTIL